MISVTQGVIQLFHEVGLHVARVFHVRKIGVKMVIDGGLKLALTKLKGLCHITGFFFVALLFVSPAIVFARKIGPGSVNIAGGTARKQFAIAASVAFVEINENQCIAEECIDGGIDCGGLRDRFPGKPCFGYDAHVKIRDIGGHYNQPLGFVYIK